MKKVAATIVVCLLLSVQTVLSQADVTTTEYPLAETGGDCLAIPRDQMALFSTPGEIFYYNQWRGHWLTMNINNPTPWTSEIITTGNGNHGHVTIYDDTVYLATDANNQLYTYSIVVNGSNELQVVQSNSSWGSYGSQRVYRGTLLKLPGSDTLMLVSRGHDGINQLDYSFWVSTDDGATFDSSGYVHDYSNNTNNRIGSFVWNNTIAMVVDTSASNTLTWFNFNRTARNWDDDGHPILNGTSRGYSMNAWNDSYQFAASSSDFTRRDSAWILYGWKYKDASAWHRDSVPASPYTDGSLALPYLVLTYIEASKRLVMTYIATDGSGDNYVGGRYWRWADSSWSAEYIVSQHATFADKIVGHRTTPIAWGDEYYIRCVCTDNNYLIRVRFSNAPDADGDNVPNDIDNCVLIANFDQADLNQNGIGDECDSLALDVDDDQLNLLPSRVTLAQNYPNPFNPETIIDYDLPRASQVHLAVFNIQGQRVKRLVDELLPAGHHETAWDGTDESGQAVASGIYLYTLETNEELHSRKMLLLK